MFTQLPTPAADSILAINELYKKDSRSNKVDLGIGVYKDESGKTPIMEAVLQAQKQLADVQKSKSYIGVRGDDEFNSLIANLLLENQCDLSQLAIAQTPGGTGAVRVLSEIIAADRKPANFWISDQTWPSHYLLCDSAGHKAHSYPYFDPSTQSVKFDEMMSSFKNLAADDIVVLHGCCHNPTGADLSQKQWAQLAEYFERRGIVPLIDIAYHGLGAGLKEDSRGLQTMVERVPTTLISYSCSKNFGLYRDRVGCALINTDSSALAKKISAYMGIASRRLYSMPPDHGGAIVRIILSDDELKDNWQNELTVMRNRVADLRQKLSLSLKQRTNDHSWNFITHQAGMFSLLGLNDKQLIRLRDEYAIYAVPGGRVNLAGLNDDNINIVADALIDIM